MKETQVSLRAALWIMPIVIALLVAGCGNKPDPQLACDMGAYRLASGDELAITPSSDDTLRYRFFDGRSGRLHRDEAGDWVSGDGWASREPVTLRVSLDGCAGARIEFHFQHAAAVGGQRVALAETPVRFQGAAGTPLYGKLVTPGGTPRALVVLVHGSEKDAATRYYALQYLLPLKGIAVFVFDKRGTGDSGGNYTQDFDMLADDIVAAIREARAMVATPGLQVGLLGGSQGGWIAPLAATRTPVDFVIAAYGMAEGPLAEDRDEVLGTLSARGHGADVLVKAREVTAATGRVMASRFREGYDELSLVKDKYSDEPWFADVDGEFSGDLLRYPGWALRIVGPWFDQGTTWDYDPLPVLDSLDVPVLWILGGRDTEAPMAATLGILESLQERGRPVDVVVFPNAEHGIIEVEGEGEARRMLGHSPGYFDLIAHWILARDLGSSYGDARLLPRRGLPTEPETR